MDRGTPLSILALVSLLICIPGGCTSVPVVRVLETHPRGDEVVAKVRSCVNHFNWFFGDKRCADERTYLLTYQIDGQQALLHLRDISRTANTGIFGSDLDRDRPWVDAPKPIQDDGFGAVQREGNLFLCTVGGRDPEHWAVIDALGRSVGDAASVGMGGPKSGFVRYTWNPATSQVAFREETQIVPSPISKDMRLNPFSIDLWDYGSGRSVIHTFTMDLGQGLEFRGGRYVPRARFMNSNAGQP